MAGQHAAPTMKDVAREAGVALGTVSKVVNGLPVGEEYRLRVEQAIEKLDYHINSYAKGLKSGKTMCIAVIMPNLISPYFSLLTNSINNALTARRYRMLYFSSDFNPEQEQELVQLAEHNKVDGIICLSYNPNLQVPEQIPLVSIDRYFGQRIPCISSDTSAAKTLRCCRSEPWFLMSPASAATVLRQRVNILVSPMRSKA